MKILFYTDAAEYGGHEVLTVHAARHFVEHTTARVGFAFYSRNEHLRAELEQLKCRCDRIDLYPLDFRSGRLQAIRTCFSFHRLIQLRLLFRFIHPDVIVVSQGRIEASSLGLLAGRIAGLPTISYLPMAHKVHISGKALFAGLRETINRYLYSLPDRIITISETAMQMLTKRGVNSSIAVVRNGIELGPRTLDREEARVRLGLNAKGYLVGVIGRIEFRQKAQDFAAQALYQFKDKLDDVTLCFVGAGPDELRLRQLISKLQLEDRALLLPWNENPADVYAALDMLLIPSRFEGVPLVMLEAMAARLPVVASAVDGMAELLPKHWCFPVGDSTALATTVSRVRAAKDERLLQEHQELVTRNFSRERFAQEFAQCVCRWVDDLKAREEPQPHGLHS